MQLTCELTRERFFLQVEEREENLSRVTEISKVINSLPICVSSSDSNLLRYQANCPVCTATMHFEIARVDEGKRARFQCPRCSNVLEATTGID